MACNTFLKISKECKEEFVIPHDKENYTGKKTEKEPYLYEIIRRADDFTISLSDELKIIFYESIGHMISAEPNLSNQERQLRSTLSSHHNQFLQIINSNELKVKFSLPLVRRKSFQNFILYSN